MNLMGLPLLSLLIWVPVLGAAIVLICGDEQNDQRVRIIALVTTLISLALSVLVYIGYDPTTYTMQFREFLPWIKAYNINYSLGVDGISLPMIILTNFMTTLVVLASWRSVQTRIPQYLAAFLAMQGMMIGVFESLDTLVFFIFWEATLIPMYLIIGIWGSANRFYAAIKFFLYTFLGSAFMLVAFLYMHSQTHSFALSDFISLKIGLTTQTLIFAAFFLAFAVKIPMWPVHTWLPDAHTEAPAGGSVILAALTLKMGAYGFLRFALPITPNASSTFTWLIIAFSLIAVVYIGLVALAQVLESKSIG